MRHARGAQPLRTFAALLLAAVTVLPSAGLRAQSDLDALMSAVLSRRDDNWKKLQQYTLTEDQSFRLVGPMETPIFGSKREYLWLPRQGFFVRSPLSADGVKVSDVERRKAEDAFLRMEQQREAQRAARRGGAPDTSPHSIVEGQPPAGEPADIPDAIRQSLEPQFVSMAYFLEFKFEAGHYAFVGRERLLDRDVLRIEYYPEKLFQDDKPRGRGGSNQPKDPAAEKKNQERKDRGNQIERQMDKVSFVTMWVEPTERQILQYDVRNIDADFLPGRWFMRLDELHASMRMGNPFPGVWLPAAMEIRAAMTLAVGHVSGIFETKYRDFREAATDSRVIIPSPAR